MALADLDDEPDWMADGLCRGAPPDLFFAKDHHSVNRARAVCLICPVKTDCLEYALEHHERTGMWGATTPKERRVILRRRRAAALA